MKLSRSERGNYVLMVLLGASATIAVVLFISVLVNVNGVAPNPASSSIATPTPSRFEGSEPSNGIDATRDPVDGLSPSQGSTSGAPGDDGQNLSLSDFFSPHGNWTEGRISVAGESNVRGIHRIVQECGPVEVPDASLELRLGNNYDNITANIGQADNSPASDQELIVQIMGNNRQIDVARIAFNDVRNVSLPVEGVNALKFYFYLNGEQGACASTDGVNVVMYDIELQ